MTRLEPSDLVYRLRQRIRRDWKRSSLRNRVQLLSMDYRKSASGLTELHMSWMASRLRRVGRRPVLLALPDKPIKHTMSIAKSLFASGWRVTDDPRSRFDAAILWQKDTMIRPPSAIEGLLNNGLHVINGRCLDIRKSHVARMFRESFGYGMEVDPTRHHGVCVCKSEINATHSGRIVGAPIQKPEPDMVYHRLINNMVDHDTVADIRTYIEGGAPCLVVHKYRQVDLRFKAGPGLDARLDDVHSEYTEAEAAAIADFCRRIGMDHGALDVLRDRDDGRIYIVDANKTPTGPPHALSPRDYRKARVILARAFEEAYLPNR